MFDAQPDNAWDRLRDVFYVRHFSNGQVYENDQSLTHPPWSTWKPFYYDSDFHAAR